MGKFADLHKRWATEKKKLSEADGNDKVAKQNKELIKKNFNKDLGPTLDDLDKSVEDLIEARKSKFNPEKILSLSPKVEALSSEAEKVASGYESFCTKQGWSDARGIATKIKNEAHAQGESEGKQWRPDKEYLDLWRYATLKMALSAAGLEDVKTAEDLRKIVQQQNQDINTARKDDREIVGEIEKYSSLWTRGSTGKEYTEGQVKMIVAGVTKANQLANSAPGATPNADSAAILKKLVPSIQKAYDSLVFGKTQAEGRLKDLKNYIKKPEVQKSASKKLGDDNVKAGEAYLKCYVDAVDTCASAVTNLPKLN